MSPPAEPLRAVVAGGGIAGLECMLALRDLAGDRVRLTLVEPQPAFELKPLRTAEPFGVDHVRRYPLREVAADVSADLLRDAVRAVHPDRHVVELAGGTDLPYDVLVVAVGARPHPAYGQAITFGAERRADALRELLADLDRGAARSVAFVVPPGVTWPLPLYELALMTAREVWAMGLDDPRLELISPERAPLAIFGERASEAVRDLLAKAAIAFRPQTLARPREDGTIALGDDEDLAADRVVTLPLLDGPRVAGVASDEDGFLRIDDHGRVDDATDVYAAGDAADFPIKQGGLACQQADAVAAHIAARTGLPPEPQPFRPVLRGKLLTGRGTAYLRRTLSGGTGESDVSPLYLWFPPAKVSGRYLSRWLDDHERRDAEHVPLVEAVAARHAGEVDVDVPLPSPDELRRRALSLDPYSPVPYAR